MARFLSLPVGTRLTIETGKRASAALLVLVIFELALVFVTWPLWWHDSKFPRVPLLPFAVPAEHFAVVAFLMLLVMIARRLLHSAGWSSICGNIARRSTGVRRSAGPASASREGDVVKAEDLRESKNSPQVFHAASLPRRPLIGALFFGIVLVMANQHRLQPWHWLLLLNLACGFLQCPVRRLVVMRNITATVYVCAALSRITPESEQSMSAVIVRQLLQQLNLQGLEGSFGGIAALCHLASGVELLIGILLLVPRTRPAGCLMAVVLHSGLLLALGPFGLNHHAGVLIWNLCFLVLVPVLYLGNDVLLTEHTRTWFAIPWRVVLPVWLFPLSGLFGVADNWPSWQLYSSRPETWTLYAHETDVVLLPAELQPFAAKPAAMDEWSAVKLDRWSLLTTASPMYPEDRFQAAVIRDVLQRCRRPMRFRIEVSSPQRFRWWLRERSVISSMEELDAVLRRN